MYDHKISDEFNFEYNRIRTTSVICSWIKNCYISLCLHSSIINQSAPNLVKIFKIWHKYNFGSNWTTRVICSWIRKIATFDSVYTLASTIINQWAPNLVKLYMIIRSRLSSITAVIGLEQLQLFALELEKLLYLTLLTLDHLQVLTIQHLGQTIQGHKISCEFHYGCNWTRTTGVICPWIWKIAIFHFVYTVASTNNNQLVPKLVKIYVTLTSLMNLIKGVIGHEQVELFALEL